MSPSRKATVLPDGTRCYSGPNCRRHGATIQNQQTDALARGNQLHQDIETLLSNIPTSTVKPSAEESIPAKFKRFPKPATHERPETWRDYEEELYLKSVSLLAGFGMNPEGVQPAFASNRLRTFKAVEVPTGIPGTRLIATVEAPRWETEKKHWGRAWLLKDDVPVAMVRYGAYREDYEGTRGNPNECSMADIETREELRGRGYGMEVIRMTEKLILGGRLIHSGGSYTPEGRAALGGKLPYTQMAHTYDHKKTLAEGKIPEASYRSMTFIHDWDDFATRGSDRH